MLTSCPTARDVSIDGFSLGIVGIVTLSAWSCCCCLCCCCCCCAGVLTSRPTARDIKIDGFSLGIVGNELIQDCSIELTIGRRYGLIGQNGCGKTSFLEVGCFDHCAPVVRASTVQYSNCGRGFQTSALASEQGLMRVSEGLIRTPVSQVKCGGIKYELRCCPASLFGDGSGRAPCHPEHVFNSKAASCSSSSQGRAGAGSMRTKQRAHGAPCSCSSRFQVAVPPEPPDRYTRY